MIWGILVVLLILFIVFKGKNNSTQNAQGTNSNHQKGGVPTYQNMKNSQNNQEAPVAPDPDPIVLSFEDRDSSKQNAGTEATTLHKENENNVGFGFCPYCGEKVNGEFAYCPNWGKNLKE